MILAVNPGSSSLKYKLYNQDLTISESGDFVLGANNSSKNHNEALKILYNKIKDKASSIEKIGVRVVHGGPKYEEPIRIDRGVIREIQKYEKFAPLHNPYSLFSVKFLMSKLKKTPIYAVFDTAFFAQMPKENSIYAIPERISQKLNIRRYGFHGISHQYVSNLIDPERKKKIISLHLGAGASVAAIKAGKPLKVSMGLTPDEGLVMQTRSGDLDPGIVLYLVEKYGFKKTKHIIENESGLKGLTETDGKMLNILLLAGEKISSLDYQLPDNLKNKSSEKSKLALDIYIGRIREYIGAYTVLLGGIDIIVFTGKIGAGSPVIQEKVTKGLEKVLGSFEVKVIEPDEELAIAKAIL